MHAHVPTNHPKTADPVTTLLNKEILRLVAPATSYNLERSRILNPCYLVPLPHTYCFPVADVVVLNASDLENGKSHYDLVCANGGTGSSLGGQVEVITQRKSIQ